MPPDENDRPDEIWRDDLFEREPDPSFLIDFLVAKIGERKERSLQLTLSELIGLGPNHVSFYNTSCEIYRSRQKARKTAGTAICGAAAIMATNAVTKAEDQGGRLASLSANSHLVRQSSMLHQLRK